MRGTYPHYVFAEIVTKFLSRKNSFVFARFLSRIYSTLFAGDLENIRLNLKQALPAGTSRDELKGLSRAVIENYASYLVDLFYMDRITKDFIDRQVEIRGIEHLDRALAGGKGVILASAHLGHWEIGGTTLAKLGYPIYGLALKHQDPRIDAIFQKRRQGNGFKIITVGASMKECYKVLRRNQILALNADRLFGEEGETVQFMNKTVQFPKGISRLSRAMGATVVPVFILMNGHDRYLMEFQEPFRDGPLLIQSFASALEKKIRQYPSQWFIFQSFWEPPQWPI